MIGLYVKRTSKTIGTYWVVVIAKYFCMHTVHTKLTWWELCSILGMLVELIFGLQAL